MKEISYNPLKMPLSWAFSIILGILGYIDSQSSCWDKCPSNFRASTEILTFMIAGFLIGWGLNSLWRKL